MRALAAAALIVTGTAAIAAPAEPLSPRVALLQQYLREVRSHEPGETEHGAITTEAQRHRDKT